MTNLEELGAGFRRARHAVDGAQSAVQVAIDRQGGALAILSRVSDGSNNTMVGDAMLALAEANVKLDEALQFYIKAGEAIDTYITERGI